MTKRARKNPRSKRARLPGLFGVADLEARGVPRSRLQGMLRDGDVQRVGRGVYRLHEAPLTELETVATVSKLVPSGIVCLLTALHIHGIGTQAPRQVWIAIDRKARKPQPSALPMRVVRFSGALLRYAIETRQVLGVPVQLTSPARTVVDCFRYRKKIGLDVALEALADAVGSRKTTIDEIARVAEVCRIRTVIAPYLESMAW